jgi:hypothetical protein
MPVCVMASAESTASVSSGFYAPLESEADTNPAHSGDDGARAASFDSAMRNSGLFTAFDCEYACLALQRSTKGTVASVFLRPVASQDR